MRISKRSLKFLLFISLMPFLSNCNTVHHAQIGNIDSGIVLKGKRFEILVSELGINLEQVSGFASAFSSNGKTKKGSKTVEKILAAFQAGPKTGNPVFSDSYADKIFKLLKKECPSGEYSGVTSIRESANYPLVSGEIVKIIAYCKE